MWELSSEWADNKLLWVEQVRSMPDLETSPLWSVTKPKDLKIGYLNYYLGFGAKEVPNLHLVAAAHTSTGLSVSILAEASKCSPECLLRFVHSSEWFVKLGSNRSF